MSTDRRRPRRPRQERLQVAVAPPGSLGGQYRPLREADVRRIHEASLHVLAHTDEPDYSLFSQNML